MTIYESDELKITKQYFQFKVVDIQTNHRFVMNFDYVRVYDEQNNDIPPWNFCKQYPIIIPVLLKAGYPGRWENGFRPLENEHVFYGDMRMIYRMAKYDDGNTFYHKYNDFHRMDGPSIMIGDDRFWHVNGKNITKDAEQWMINNNYRYPFDKPTQDKFILTFA